MLELESQIKSVIISSDKAFSNIIKLELIIESPNNNIPVVFINKVIKLEVQIKSFCRQQAQPVI